MTELRKTTEAQAQFYEELRDLVIKHAKTAPINEIAAMLANTVGRMMVMMQVEGFSPESVEDSVRLNIIAGQKEFLDSLGIVVEDDGLPKPH